MADPKWPMRLRDVHAQAHGMKNKNKKGVALDQLDSYFIGRVVVTVTELPSIAYAIERNDDGTFDVLVDK